MIDIEDLFQRADDVGVRLEVINGLAVWEVHPNLTHQEAIDQIRQSIKVSDHQTGQSCACLHYADLHVRFPDGSDKRPDISIFCQRPTETESAVTQVPEAVVEIISHGYEAKDLQLGPPFYLSQGVKDVIVFDPYTKQVYHFDARGTHHFESPTLLGLQCGCQLTV